MASDRASLVALRELIADTNLTLETIPNLPQNRTGHCRENLRAALALADDLIKQSKMTATAVMGDKGGSTTARNGGEGLRASGPAATQIQVRLQHKEVFVPLAHPPGDAQADFDEAQVVIA